MTHVLVVAPHPDDEVIGCGASMAKHASEGSEVTVAIVIARERSLHDELRSDADFTDETRKASAALGVHRWELWDEPSRDFLPSRKAHLDLRPADARGRPTSSTYRTERTGRTRLPMTGPGPAPPGGQTGLDRRHSDPAPAAGGRR
ncbi:hypothetical protein SANTM175S_03614 [Streptomyces antimycoticus]